MTWEKQLEIYIGKISTILFVIFLIASNLMALRILIDLINS